MQIQTVAGMQQMDEMAIQEIGLPSIVLMEHAAMEVARYVTLHLHKNTNILILCGPGNNGGDGFALARLLQQAGFTKVQLFSKEAIEELKGDARIMAMSARNCGIPILITQDQSLIHSSIKMCDCIIDALFGTGLNREIKGFYHDVVEMVNTSNKQVISIDIPSGIHGDNGHVMGCAIKASVTITFECLKKGQLQNKGKEYSGTLIPVSICMPKPVLSRVDNGIHVINEELVAQLLPKRKAFTHKGSYGKELMIGGSEQMHGAITLCAQAALKSGVGTLTLFIPEGIREVVSKKMEECMLITAPQEDGFFAEDAYIKLQEILSSYDVISIGNGMGRGSGAFEIVRCVLESDLPCIVDGVALFLASRMPTLLKNRKALTILTPHPKEFGYLSNKTINELQMDIFKSVDDFVKECTNVVIVAKDTYTLISDGIQCYMHVQANDALAKGGSGDVLCGIIAGLYAQGRNAMESCVCGVYVHAMAAHKLMETQDTNSILPSDVIKEISSIYKALRLTTIDKDV